MKNNLKKVFSVSLLSLGGWKRTITRANKNDIFAGYYVKYKNTMNNN